MGPDLVLYLLVLENFNISASNFITYKDKTILPSYEPLAALFSKQALGWAIRFVVIIPLIFNESMPGNSLQDRYKLIAYGIKDSDILREERIVEGTLDTILLCRKSLKELDKGHEEALACWNPTWSTFIGYHLTRSVLADIFNSGEWKIRTRSKNLMSRSFCSLKIQGVLVKNQA
ncbi:hypothetical protein N7451_004834 [Penicillium sp. IBT 35674x]|nr:hypothetical protein N7451_004834 [Penicillium sp. IBT 35674x]